MSILSEEYLQQAIDSVERMFAVIVFTPQGIVVDANPIFLDALGYQKADIVGQHHRIFCDEATVSSSGYKDFWDSLAGGAANSGTFHRLRKDGSSIYLYAEYAALKNPDGEVSLVIKIAQNISSMAQNLSAELGMSEKLLMRFLTLRGR